MRVSLEDRVLAVGHGSDGHHRKHTECWRERVGQEQHIFSFDVVSRLASSTPQGRLQRVGTETILYLYLSSKKNCGLVQWTLYETLLYAEGALSLSA